MKPTTALDNTAATKDSLNRLNRVAKLPITDMVTPTLRQKSSNVNMVLPHLRSMVEQHAEQNADSENIFHLLPDLEIAKQTLIDNILSPTDLQEGNLSIGLHKEAPAEMNEMIRVHFSSDGGYNYNKKQPVFIEQSLVTIGSVALLPVPPSAVRKVIHDNTYGLESVDGTFKFNKGVYNCIPLGTLANIKPNQTAAQALYSTTSEKIKSYSLEGALDDTATALIKGVGAEEVVNNTTATELLKSYKGIKDEITKANADQTLVELTDNPAYIFHGMISKSVKDYNIKTKLALGWGMESVNDKNNPLAEYRDRSVSMLPYLELLFNKDKIDTLDPIVIHWPSESVIPILNPTTREHIAYYLVADLDGQPLRCGNYQNRYRQLSDKLDNTVHDQAMTVNYTFGVSYPGSNTVAMNERSNSAILLSAYQERFERELKEVIANGDLGVEVDIAKVPDIYRMMFTRQLEKQATRVIYVPADRLSYMAYNYSPEGIGVSLVEKTKLYSSFRAVLIFAQLMAAVKSSINRSHLTITLDDKEIDPRGTVEMVRNEMANLQADGFPVYKFQSQDIIDSILKAGMQTTVNGAQYPNTSVELVESKRDVSAPATDLQDMLKEMQYQGWGLSLDLLEKANQIDFMGQIDNINLLQSKRMLGKQAITCERGANFIKTYLRCGGKFYNELNAIRESNKCNLTMEEIIDSLTLILPKADYAQHKAQATAFTDYTTFITDVMDAVVSDSELGSLLKGENVSGDIAGVKTILINELRRRYLKSRNILPELFELVSDPEKTLKGILEEHVKTNVSIVGDLANMVAKEEKKADDKIQLAADKLNPPPPEDDASDDGVIDGDAGDEGGSSDGDVNDMAGDDAELDVDGAGDDMSVDETDSADDTDTPDTASSEEDNPDDETEEGDEDKVVKDDDDDTKDK
jgi:hypothetical protein